MITDVPNLPPLDEAFAEDEFALLEEFLLPGEELTEVLMESSLAR
jgi:hypothetical protein